MLTWISRSTLPAARPLYLLVYPAPRPSSYPSGARSGCQRQLCRFAVTPEEIVAELSASMRGALVIDLTAHIDTVRRLRAATESASPAAAAETFTG